MADHYTEVRQTRKAGGAAYHQDPVYIWECVCGAFSRFFDSKATAEQDADGHVTSMARADA